MRNRQVVKGNIKKQAPVAEPLNKSVTRAVYIYPERLYYSSQQMSYWELRADSRAYRNSKVSRLEETVVDRLKGYT